MYQECQITHSSESITWVNFRWETRDDINPSLNWRNVSPNSYLWESDDAIRPFLWSSLLAEFSNRCFRLLELEPASPDTTKSRTTADHRQIGNEINYFGNWTTEITVLLKEIPTQCLSPNWPPNFLLHKYKHSALYIWWKYNIFCPPNKTKNCGIRF